jgi:hydrogenase nickel incorporation protein HypA/HybF
MHEFSIVQALIGQVDREIEKSGSRGRVMAVELVIGRLSGVHADALRFAFEVLAPQTVLQSADLRIVETPAAVECRTCRVRSEWDQLSLRCPNCGGEDVVIDGGRELLLQTIELDDEFPEKTF